MANPNLSYPDIPIPDADDFVRVVFLDIDGVLNGDCHVPGKPVIDEAMVGCLARVVEATDARVVLSSSWKDAWRRFEENGFRPSSRWDSDLVLLKELFDRHGLSVADGTPTIGSGPASRPHEICVWLACHSCVEEFVILDDDDFWELGWLSHHFVCTQTKDEAEGGGYALPARGLTDEHARRAIAILGGDLS